jgi:hypothetical protein
LSAACPTTGAARRLTKSPARGRALLEMAEIRLPYNRLAAGRPRPAARWIWSQTCVNANFGGFLACLLLWPSLAFAQAGRCTNLTTPPAPAAAVGYNKLIFCDDWPDLNSIDVQNVCQSQTTPGDCINPATGKPFKWFPYEGWPSVGRCAGEINFDVGCQNTVTARPSYIALHPGGGLDLTASPPSIITQANGVNWPVGAALVSCRDDGHSGEWMGFVQPAAAYVRWYVYNVPDPTPGDALQPAIWAEPVEMLAASAATSPPIPNPWIEFDWIETGFSTGVGTIHDWTGLSGAQGLPQAEWAYWPSVRNVAVASLLIPASLGNGTGSLYGYINDAIPPTGSNAPAVPVTWTPGARWSEIEQQHQCLIIWAAQSPTSLGSVEVWAASGSPTPPAPSIGGGSPKWFRGH